MARARSGFNQCLTAVETAAGRELKEEEVEIIYSKLQGRIRRYRDAGASEVDAHVRAGRELGDEMRLQGVIEKRAKLRNELIKRGWDQKLGSEDEAAKLRAWLTGREGTRARGGIAESTDAKVHGITAEIISPFVAKLDKAGLRKPLAAGDPAFDRDVARELWAVELGTGSVTGNKQAREAATIINEAQERARTMQNDAGAWIGKLEHYVTRQSHDMEKLRREGYPAWRDFMLPRLDPRTFDTLDELTPEAIEGFMQRTYNALASGVHDTATGAQAFGEVGRGTGTSNLARRASAERKLFFKDADAWFDYNQQFGRGTLLDAVRSGLEGGARNVAVMRDWGTNPEAMFETVVDRAKKRARDRGDFKEVDRLAATWNQRIFDTITGRSAVPENITYAQITAWGSAWQTVSKLGGVVLSSFPDLATNAAALRHNGVGLFESYWNQLSSTLPKGTVRREIGQLAGAGLDSFLGSVASRFTAVDSVRGNAARLVDVFHKMNLLNWWTESMKHGIATILTHNMGRLAQRSFDQLDPRMRVTMERYGITADDWNAARATTQKMGDGRAYMMPVLLEDPALRTKFQTYVSDQIREAMTEPDAYARTATTWGTQAGTASGAAVRLIMQFKTYPVTFMRRTLNREWNRGDGRDVMGLAHLIVGTTLLGYASMELKNMARGREPRTLDAMRDQEAGDYARLVAAAMMQGGGFGLYGDFLFADVSRMGQGPVASLLGPTIGMADDISKLIPQLRQWALEGDPRAGQDFRASAFGVIKDHAPFVNLFYTRAALDYFIFYRLQEAMNPGFLSRYEDRLRREQDVHFMLSPTVSPYR
jgi:hypothetical protein